MLTLVKSKDAVPIVGIYVGKKHKKPVATVYFTHEINEENANVARCAGVLHLHKNAIKKELHLNETDYKAVCQMVFTSSGAPSSSVCAFKMDQGTQSPIM